MKKDRLLMTISSLNQKGIKRLEEIVYSPFFNKDKKCIELFEMLKPFAPDFQLSEEEKSTIAENLSEGKEWNDASISFIRSRLLQLINELLVYYELEDRKGYKNHLLIKALLKQGSNKYALSVYNQVNKQVSLQTKMDIDTLHEQYLLEEDYMDFLVLEKGRNSKQHAIEVIHRLDNYYIARKLNLAVELLSLKSIVGLNYDDVLLDAIELQIHHPLFNNNDFIKLYYYILQFLKNEENESAFHLLMETLNTPSAKQFKKDDLNIFYTHAANFCAKRMKSGRTEFMEHLFSIQLALIENKLIYKGGYVQANRMKNIISISCQLGKTDWAKEFLDHYQKDLNPKIKESSTQMFKAFICFYNKDFEGTLFELGQIQSDIDALFFLNVRTFQLRCYYELGESDAFYSLYKTFRDYLRRTKKEIATTKKQSHTSFNRIAYMLYRKKEGFSNKSITDIRQKIEGTKPLELKSWLLEKCDELNT